MKSHKIVILILFIQNTPKCLEFAYEHPSIHLKLLGYTFVIWQVSGELC